MRVSDDHPRPTGLRFAVLIATVAILTAGCAFAWGDNSFGQLGDNTFIDQNVPTQVLPMNIAYDDIDAGAAHSCGIRPNKSLWCWGANNSGQLGDGTTTASPIAVQESTGATDWATVSARGQHTCAIKNTGTLWCWGAGVSGRLGNGGTAGSLTPVQESSGATDWESVAIGSAHSCAIKTTGTLWCWGAGLNGQTGNGGTADVLVPTQETTGATDWDSIDAGQWHNCAVQDDGTLWCWGINDWGQLGDGTTTQSATPLQLGALTTWATASAGRYHSCATRTDLTLWCWGLGTTGQLGDGLFATSASPVQESTGATDWELVSIGELHSCGLKTGGTIHCWGSNADGQLGDGTNIPRGTPVQVGTDTDWTMLSAGHNYTIGVRGI